jgi:membrane-associated phospholipid phosphatase
MNYLNSKNAVCAAALLGGLAYSNATLAAEPALDLPPSTAAPAPPKRLWRPEWPTFSWIEGAGTIAAGVGTLVLFMIEPPHDPRWEGGILFDDALRDGMRLSSSDDRKAFRTIGDYPYFAAALLPLIADPLIAAWAIHGDGKAALNMELMGLEAFSYAGFLSFVSTRLSVRERPDSMECRTGPDPEACPESDTESFWSGHTSIVAASAGIVCANHRAMPLWGHPIADAGACALATSGALLTGVTRIMADRHYATDVLVGFGIGFGFGYGVPTLLHYGRRKANVSLSVRPGPCTGGCVTLSGAF